MSRDRFSFPPVLSGPSRRLFLLGGLAALSGCASPPAATFDISPAAMARAGGGRGLLVVAEPVAVSLLDSDRIVVRTRDNGVAYLKGAQWPQRLPSLLQARLIQSFENARRVGSVGRPGERLNPAHQLNVEIRTFEVQEATGEAVIEMTVKIVNDRTGRIVAAEMFAGRTPSAIDGPAAAQALNGVAQGVMANIVQWTSGRA